jgi:hypothetical protein
VVDEMRAGVSYDTDPKELNAKQVGVYLANLEQS